MLQSWGLYPGSSTFVFLLPTVTFQFWELWPSCGNRAGIMKNSISKEKLTFLTMYRELARHPYWGQWDPWKDNVKVKLNRWYQHCWPRGRPHEHFGRIFSFPGLAHALTNSLVFHFPRLKKCWHNVFPTTHSRFVQMNSTNTYWVKQALCSKDGDDATKKPTTVLCWE